MNNTLKIGIAGVGWVGAQLKKYFEEVRDFKVGENLLLYDILPEKCAGNIEDADVIFVTLPTPRSRNDGSCNISIVTSAIAKLDELSKDSSKIIVIKSTVPPGTTEDFQKKYPRHKFLFNPEFLTESRAWEDMMRPDRQIIGYTEHSLDAAQLVLSLLPKAPFMSPWGTGTYHQTRISATEAEFIKYAGNLHFVRKVNWANALARAAEKMGVNYENVRKGMAADHRIGDSHLDVHHGGYRGWGGSCFPKDLDAFIQFAKSEGLSEVETLLMSDRNFNETLLQEQGLSLELVSDHIDKLAEKLKKKA
ncbi:MAG: UDP-glucose/GDP-mannose dehydrogenase family protein [Candidatus Harrisonbacteria bacterium]|nr:UDP-glucose/GDP-mannose dehydrogenase family protein [Candidatus Harrisonbacteria bacterium]